MDSEQGAGDGDERKQLKVGERQRGLKSIFAVTIATILLLNYADLSDPGKEDITRNFGSVGVWCESGTPSARATTRSPCTSRRPRPFFAAAKPSQTSLKERLYESIAPFNATTPPTYTVCSAYLDDVTI